MFLCLSFLPAFQPQFKKKNQHKINFDGVSRQNDEVIPWDKQDYDLNFYVRMTLNAWSRWLIFYRKCVLPCPQYSDTIEK